MAFDALTYLETEKNKANDEIGNLELMLQANKESFCKEKKTKIGNLKIADMDGSTWGREHETLQAMIRKERSKMAECETRHKHLKQFKRDM